MQEMEPNDSQMHFGNYTCAKVLNMFRALVEKENKH